jgi:transcriptional regulator with XRE-family HTH domain
MPNTLNDVNRGLKRLRTSRGFTQQQLAVAAGLSVAAVAQIERGRNHHPRVDTMLALAKALGVTVDELCNT